LEAWRSFTTLRNPDAVDAWLNGIVRNVCARWRRTRRREATWLRPDQELPGEGDPNALVANVAEPFDLELLLDRQELAELLDCALALLPATTRDVLVRKYIAEARHAEIADQLGMNENAVTVCLHRGKLALRKLLTTSFSNEAMALGVIMPQAAGWHVTRIWCFTCGQHYLLGQFNQVEGHLRLRCPGCCNPHDANDLISNSQTDFLHKFKSYKPAYASVLKWIYAYYIENAQAGIVHCRQCGQAIPIRLGAPPGRSVYPDDIYAWCERCQLAAGTETWWSLTQSLPQFHQFWQEYPRMRAIPVRHLTIANTPAVLTSYESVATGARIEAAFSTNTFEVIYVERYK